MSITADSNGVIYITDWADREYSVHQKGRIWRLAAKPGVQVSKPEGATAHAKSSPALERMTQLLNAHSSGDYNELMRALTDVNPFIRSAAVSSLSQSVYRPNALHDVTHEDPQVRIGVLLALRRAKYDQAVPLLRKFISDPDEQVRRMALVWIGEDILKELANDIDRALGAGPLSPTLFSTYLASAEILAFGEPGSTQANSKDIWAAGRTRSQFIDRIIEDELKPINLRALAISMVPDLSDEKSLDALTKVAHGNVLQLQIEAVRTLAESSQSKVVSLLQSLAFNKNNPANLRAEAIAGLARQPVDVLWSVIDLLDDPSEPGSNGSNASLANGGNGQSRPKGFRQEIRGEQKGGV